MEPLRLGGLVSGLDTNSIVENILQAERLPAVRLELQIAEEQVKLNAFSSLDLALTDLRSKSTKLDSFLTWQQMNAEATKDASDNTILTASATFSAEEANYSVNATKLAQSHMIASDSQSSTASALSLTGDFIISGETISVSSSDTLEDIRTSINEASVNMDADEKVFASIIDKTLVIERVKTGDTDIVLSDSTGTVLEDLGVLTGVAVKNELKTSEDLAATINQIAITSSENTGLTTIIAGVTLNFENTGSSTLTISHDTDTIKSLIDEFITSYNDAMELMEQQNSVDLNSEGDTITEVGILQGENIIGDILRNARTIITSTETDPGLLDQDFNNLNTIGIWTAGRENRLSVIDSSKLDQALKSNFEEVEDLFRDLQAGVIGKFDDYIKSLTDPIDGIVSKRQETLQESIIDSQDRVDLVDARLADREVELFEQFARMEDAMAQINSVSSQVLGSIGG